MITNESGYRETSPMAKDIARGIWGSFSALTARVPALWNRLSRVSLKDGNLLLSRP